MRMRHVFGWGMVVLVISTVQVLAGPPSVLRFVNATVEQSEQSLAIALTSNSPGLQTTAAQTVRDLKVLLPARTFSPLVIPLMRLVKDESEETASRVLAALALHDLHSSVGDFAIARTAEFTDSEQLRHLCWWLAHYRLMEQQEISAGQGSQLHRFLGEWKPEPLTEDEWMTD